MIFRPAPCLSSALAFFGFALATSCVPVVAADRDFVPTMLVDDPEPENELSLPSFARLSRADGTRETDVATELSTRITERLAVSLSTAWSRIGKNACGFQNLSSTLKYATVSDEDHEFVLSTGLGVDWGGTGAARVGAETFNTYSLQMYVGKGFGDLLADAGVLRALAVTGEAGLVVPGRFSTRASNSGNSSTGDDVDRHSISIKYGFSIQYSLPYLHANVSPIGGPEMLRHLTPLVEVAFETPLTKASPGSPPTSALAASGLVYSSQSWQLAVEAIVPLNASSGKHVGIMAQLHFALDAIMPAIHEGNTGVLKRTIPVDE